MKKLMIILFFVIFILSLPVSSSQLRLAIKNTGKPVQWENIGHFINTPNPPLVMITIPFPFDQKSIVNELPPSHIPVLLQLELTTNSEGAAPPTQKGVAKKVYHLTTLKSSQKNKKLENYSIEILSQKNLDKLSQLLQNFKNISHISLKGWQLNNDFQQLAFLIKTISSIIRGIGPKIQIALTCPDNSGDRDLLPLLQTLATNPGTSPYFNCFFLESTNSKKIIEQISPKAPHIYYWEMICPADDKQKIGIKDELSRILSCLLKNNPFSKSVSTLLVLPTNQGETLYPLLLRFSDYFGQTLYKDTLIKDIKYSDGTASQHPIFFRSTDQAQILFLYGDGKKKTYIPLTKGIFKKAIVKNLRSGREAVFKIFKNSTTLMLNLKNDIFAVHLIPRKQKLTRSKYKINVSGQYQLTAQEIIARVRAWKARQKIQLKNFTATMSTSMRLRIGNLKETFDLTIKGPMFAERNKPYDWVWKEFFVNGVKWKSKKVPKIPLLQPEKVNIMPLDISLTEEYDYSLAGETKIEGHQVYIIDIKPRKEVKSSSLYQGRIWIDTQTFIVRREHLIQLNLKGEVISNVETRNFKPIKGSQKIWLPVSVKGQQVFSTAGRLTNVERKVTLTDIKINPQKFLQQKEQALQSNFQMVRDTEKGLRYLIKDKKSGERKVEWQTKKSQLFGVLGGFYDSSISYPIPLLGFNYMNFNLGGKGRQANILFGGVMLTANYSDPSFLGSKMDLGANLVAVAFPFVNKIFHHGSSAEVEEERLKRLPFRFQINSGIPLGSYLKYTSIFFAEYHKFSLTKKTSDDFILPENTLTLGWRSRFTFNIKGYRLAFWGEIARRLQWKYWGLPGNDQYNPNQRSYLRWRVVLDKDFFLSTFRKIHLTASYFDGLRLDRFSAYKYGFFNELNIHGYMSGVVQATRAFLINLSYGYSLGKAFRLELFYDSTWVSNPASNYHNTYFSGTAISGTINIPRLKGILRFEAGVPVISNGIKGMILYFVLLKMF